MSNWPEVTPPDADSRYLRWQGGGDPWDLPPEGPPRRKRPRRDRRGWIVLVVLLAVILLVTVLLFQVGLNVGRDSAGQSPWEALPDLELPTQAAQSPTTVERMEPRGDVTLTLQPGEGQPLSYQAIYQAVIPSIVSVRGYQDSGGSLGTGVVASANGYIITNAHVIEGCSAVEIILQDDAVCPALLVGMDSESDLAVLKIEAEGLTPAQFGDSDALVVGDVALAIGNPLGDQLRGTMTDGIISAINRDIMVDGYSMVLIQTTAALNSGNSGGALLNDRGQVVGITNMKMSSYYDTVEGLGFAIPSTTVKQVCDALIAQGHISGRPTIGVTVRTLTQAAADGYGVPLGVRVEEVQPASDAFAQGVEVGDVIVSANGAAVETIEDLNDAKAGLGVGDVLDLRIFRDGDYLDISVTLVDQYTLDE